MAEEGRTKFRKYVASIMAAATVGTILYGWLSGIISTVDAGLGGGIIIGLASKYLWEENTS
ncbi:hypothetical protein LCGC14_1262040 [marine sediment metagenome]|uniref:Uncharacterized protein n=1 Tax=marine sediment metagenome TaxID=412755 RepID=A0A0F9LLN7_9ZZZZ